MDQVEARPGIDLSEEIVKWTERFTGRQWVFDRLDEWLAGDEPSHYLIGGGPGSGKTALAARLVQIDQGDVPAGSYQHLQPGFLTYYHFCRAQEDSTLRPQRFVGALSEALAGRFEIFRRKLLQAVETRGDTRLQANVNQTVSRVERGGQVIGLQINLGEGENARTAFDLLVREPLQWMIDEARQTESIVILVDSLDEALTFDPHNNLVSLLQRLGDFPKQVRFLFTSRDDRRVETALGEPNLDLVNDAETPDMYDYAYGRLAALAESDRKIFAHRLDHHSGGNFLYTRYVLDDLLPRLGEGVDLENLPLPEDLAGHYRTFIKREMGDPLESWQRDYSPVLGAIALGRGSGLNADQLSRATGLQGSQVQAALTKSDQYLTGPLPDGPFRIYHHSFREFLLADKTYQIFPAEIEAGIAKYAMRSCRRGWSTCDDDYALAFAPIHLAEAARLNEDEAAHTLVSQLVELAGSQDYQDGYEARFQDIVALLGHLELALQRAAQDEEEEGLALVVEAANALLDFRQHKLDPATLLDLAAAGRLEEAETRLALFTPELRWRSATLLLMAWLALPKQPAAAAGIRDRLQDRVQDDEALSLFWQRLDAAVRGVDLPAGALPDPGPVPDPGYLESIISRMGGGEVDESYRFLDEAISEEMVYENRRLLQEGVLKVQGKEGPVYVGDVEGQILLSYAANHPEEGQDYLRRYVQVHAVNNYVYYRNQSLWGVLNAVLRHPSADWARQALRTIVEAALTGSRLHFQEGLPASLASLTGRPVPVSELVQAAEDKIQKQIHGTGRGDRSARHLRRLAALAEALALAQGDGSQAKRLLQEAAGLREGFAGFRAPACLTLAESMRVCGLEGQKLQEALDAAEIAAQNIQDPVFCVRTVARVTAMRALTWEAELDVRAAAEGLLADPDGPDGAALHCIGEDYHLRRVKVPEKLPLPDLAYEARRLAELADLYQRPLASLQRLNPDYPPYDELKTGTMVRIPDPGFGSLLAARLAAEALVAPGLTTYGRTALIQSLVPLAAADPTALDIVLARLLLAARPDDPAILSGLERAVDKYRQIANGG